jgi:Tfp pilus assembly protein PilO
VATKDEKLKGNNLYIVLVLVSLLVVGVTVIVTKTLIGSIAINTKVVSAKSLAKKQLTADLTAAPQLVDAYSALGSQSQVLADALPNTADFPGLIVTLENMGNNAGIQLKSVDPNAGGGAVSIAAPGGATTSSVSTPGPETYPFAVSFSGTYDGLQKFLSEVETSARPMRVIGLELSGSGSSLTGDIDMQTFYQAQGQLPFSEETIK